MLYFVYVHAWQGNLRFFELLERDKADKIEKLAHIWNWWCVSSSLKDYEKQDNNEKYF